MNMDSTRFFANSASGPALQNQNSTATNPTLTPDRTEAETGIGGTNDELSLICVGIEMVKLDSVQSVNFVGMTIDAPDQVDETSANGSTWRQMQTQALTIDWDGGILITATDGLGLFLGDPTQTADQATTITTASTLYVSSPTAGGNITITNNYPINTESAAFLTAAGVWTDNPSTVEKKHDIADASPMLMKEAIQKIRGRSWVYNDEWGDEGRTRYGVVAEEQPDFLYGLGTTQRNVTSPSIMAGFCLASVKYLEQRISELEAQVQHLTH